VNRKPLAAFGLASVLALGALSACDDDDDGVPDDPNVTITSDPTDTSLSTDTTVGATDTTAGG